MQVDYQDFITHKLDASCVNNLSKSASVSSCVYIVYFDFAICLNSTFLGINHCYRNNNGR